MLCQVVDLVETPLAGNENGHGLAVPFGDADYQVAEDAVAGPRVIDGDLAFADSLLDGGRDPVDKRVVERAVADVDDIVAAAAVDADDRRHEFPRNDKLCRGAVPDGFRRGDCRQYFSSTKRREALYDPFHEFFLPFQLGPVLHADERTAVAGVSLGAGSGYQAVRGVAEDLHGIGENIPLAGKGDTGTDRFAGKGAHDPDPRNFMNGKAETLFIEGGYREVEGLADCWFELFRGGEF